MFCPKCGEQLEDDARFCPACGAPVKAAQPQAQTTPQPQTMSQTQAMNQTAPPQNQGQYGYTQSQGQYGYPQNQPYNPAPYRPVYNGDPLNDPRGMNWFKFIIYFQLFAGALVNLIGGIMCLTGSQYGGQAYLVYSYFPGLKTLDVLYGIICIALAVFGIYTRQRLAKFYRNGPTLYYILMGTVVLVSIIYLIAASSVLDVPLGDTLNASTLVSMLSSLVMLVINIVYFNKRADLFIH